MRPRRNVVGRGLKPQTSQLWSRRRRSLGFLLFLGRLLCRRLLRGLRGRARLLCGLRARVSGRHRFCLVGA